MDPWRIVKYLLVGAAVLVSSCLLAIALGLGQLFWSLQPHTRMASIAPNGSAKVMMVENHKLADIGVRIILDRNETESELLYGEDCSPEFVHFAWSSDSDCVVVCWRDRLCHDPEHPILKAWDTGSGQEIPVDESLRALLGDDIRKTYANTETMSSTEALEWALSGSNHWFWDRENPEPFWLCPWCD